MSRGISKPLTTLYRRTGGIGSEQERSDEKDQQSHDGLMRVNLLSFSNVI